MRHSPLNHQQRCRKEGNQGPRAKLARLVRRICRVARTVVGGVDPTGDLVDAVAVVRSLDRLALVPEVNEDEAGSVVPLGVALLDVEAQISRRGGVVTVDEDNVVSVGDGEACRDFLVLEVVDESHEAISKGLRSSAGVRGPIHSAVEAVKVDNGKWRLKDVVEFGQEVGG